MNPRTNKTLLARVSPGRFAGRIEETERLYLHAISGTEPNCVRLSGAPGAGTSEMLRQLYDRLFHDQRFVVPFYFCLRSGDRNSRSAASRFAYEFLLQAIAFRRNDPSLIAASPNILELVKLAPLADAEWVDRISKSLLNETQIGDEREFIRSVIAEPFRLASNGKMRVCVILDDLHKAADIDGGKSLIDEISSLAATVKSPLILAARRRFSIDLHSRQTIDIGPLPRNDAEHLVETLAVDAGVAVSEQTRDLIAVQFGGNPLMIRSLIQAASEKKRGLGTYREVEQIYAGELLNGRIGDHFDKIFSHAAPEPDVRRKLVEMLYPAMEHESGRFPLSALRDRLELSPDAFDRLTESLVLDEVIQVEGSIARLTSDDLLFDFLDAHNRLDGERKTSAAVAASAVMRALTRAPQMMARAYRREAALGVQDLMPLFDVQDIPLALIDYRLFRDRYKGISDHEIREQLAAETEKFTLPQISHVGPIADRLERFGEIIEPERAIAGVGFTDREYRDADQIAWLTVEIDSKLEADYPVTAEWCDRLDAAAAGCNFLNYRIWLISPEGFSDGALDLLAERNGFGSSRNQAVLLRNFLSGKSGVDENGSTEYEIVIPAGEDSELIAAHALEEIARRYDFPVKAVNQMKTALVEASINAAEHGLSPDRKIYQKFVIDKEKIVLTVSNRGLRLSHKTAEKAAAESTPNENRRRGWGLNLMRSLMDDIQIESVDDGTRIVMTKYAAA